MFCCLHVSVSDGQKLKVCELVQISLLVRSELVSHVRCINCVIANDLE